MPKRLIDLGAKPLLDVASYARRGPGRRDRLSHDEIELIARTVRRTPEVMVKVLSRGGQDLKAIGRHLGYLNRGGEVDIETDDGQRVSGKRGEEDLLEDWDLDLEEHRRKADLESQSTRRPPKLVHKLMFSMPAGTTPEKVLAAVKDFAREEFGLKHRYAMVLHTDQPHPHVHMVVKAVSEDGVRLNVRKATLRGWRRQFAHHLRALGVAANATERAVRGQSRTRKSDAIYRATLRGDSIHTREREEAVASQIRSRALVMERDKASLVATRKDVERGWYAVSEILLNNGHRDLAEKIAHFVNNMGQPCTEREQIAAALAAASRKPRTLEADLARG
jgi:hypothetical protein